MSVKENKYRNWYRELMIRTKKRKNKFEGCERHHIKPRSFGGSDHPRNIVLLTYREHFLAHWLLTKFTSGMNKMKMLRALMQMRRKGRGHKRIISSWQYAVAKRAMVELMTGRIVSEATRKKFPKHALVKAPWV